jgi:hypothetical protein
MKAFCNLIAALTMIVGLTGCPPMFYCSVTNHTRTTVRINVEHDHGPSFLPHFALGPGESRRVPIGQPDVVLVAEDIEGRRVGRLNLGTISEHSPYYDLRTYTYGVVVERTGVMPARVEK